MSGDLYKLVTYFPLLSANEIFADLYSSRLTLGLKPTFTKFLFTIDFLPFTQN